MGKEPDARVDWSYDFACGRTVADILAIFNAAGPWRWQMRDSQSHGDYLRCEPAARARITLYAYSDSWPIVMEERSRTEWRNRFNVWIELSGDSASARQEIDGILRGLLAKIDATGIAEK